MPSISVPWRPTSGGIVYRQPQRRKPGLPARFHRIFSDEAEARRIFGLASAHAPTQLLKATEVSVVDGALVATTVWHVVIP